MNTAPSAILVTARGSCGHCCHLARRLLQSVDYGNSYWIPMYEQRRFYIRGSVHRNPRLKKSNEMQQYADIYLLLNYSICFGRPSRPSSGVHKTVVAASGTDHTVREACFFKRDQISSRLKKQYLKL